MFKDPLLVMLTLLRRFDKT